MKNKKAKLVFGLTVLLCAFFAACHNPIMETWWGLGSGKVYHTVKFDTEGGIPAQEDQLVADRGKIAKLQAMSKTVGGVRWGFGGWFTDTDFTNEWHFATDTVTDDLTLYAKWSPPPQPGTPTQPDPPTQPGTDQAVYTVNFVTNGGGPDDGRSTTLPALHILAGAKIPEPPALRRADMPEDWHGFGGWFTDPDFTNEWHFATDRVTSDLTLYAKWQPTVHCLVTFEANGGTPEPGPQDLLEWTRVKEPFAMTKSGFGFGGWYKDPAFKGQWNFSTDRVEETSLILYARWVTNSFTVTFVPNGGSPAPESQSVEYGAMAARPPAMRNPGLSLAGWYTDEALTNEWNFSTPVTADITLYAKWETAHYIVKFDLKPPPGTSVGQARPVPVDQDIVQGGRISEPPPVTIPGWYFYGWYTTDTPGPKDAVWEQGYLNSLEEWDFNTPVIGNHVSIVDDKLTLTLYARWIPFDPDMVWVQKGSFTMGGGAGASPAHDVTLTKGFYAGKYQVTQAQYQNTMGSVSNVNANPSQFQAGQPTRPVERVSWFDAILYCITLTDQANAANPGLNLTQVYTINNVVRPSTPATTSVAGSISSATVNVNWDANGYRLPTEAEWEYAARGGNGSPGGFVYAGSNNVDEVAWYDGNSSDMTHQAGTKAPNGLGIYDMNGNVSEWCWDWFGSRYYSERNNDVDPKGPSNGTERVRRGGNWNNVANNVRNVSRNSADPANANWAIGFRVVRGVVGMY